MTSHDVVAAARRALREKRIGHAGTLDPFATGLLVLMVGRATRLLPHMSGDPKVYEAVIRFGSETTTADLHGEVVATAPVPTHEQLLAALPTLTGELDQIPPVYSAKRIGGQRAYDLARAGVAVEMRPARVRVDAWTPGRWDPPNFSAHITCGGGTYIRSLARDLGRLVGSAAHLVALRRLRSGPFDVAHATTLDALAAGGAAPLLAPRAALGEVAEQQLDAEDVARVARGIAVPATVPGDRVALLNAANGALVAYAERRAGLWQPRVVMRPADGG
ncbi:MAG: tRNA pseudouridine(55) synthase [uncultured Gemmatimonadaceae bacterium]|uniref:tRNA pseudouridine synthase B n=1 Tax=uncultured Gemmatimonadaceae bacterium TaxID=246130 RepID=A0A6J4MKW7_9BACT|nr:MAG: tRNA pseudouridine(55) synthase [uncultured Gemmatimonadaceae bacterium]